MNGNCLTWRDWSGYHWFPNTIHDNIVIYYAIEFNDKRKIQNIIQVLKHNLIYRTFMYLRSAIRTNMNHVVLERAITILHITCNPIRFIHSLSILHVLFFSFFSSFFCHQFNLCNWYLSAMFWVPLLLPFETNRSIVIYALNSFRWCSMAVPQIILSFSLSVVSIVRNRIHCNIMNTENY